MSAGRVHFGQVLLEHASLGVGQQPGELVAYLPGSPSGLTARSLL
jgi:hypothetical protein